MTVFYKATRPNGTDFYTGTVDYAAALTSGVPVTVPPGLADDHGFPGPGWLHLATVPTECVGMGWPCRLFEVEPVGDVMMDSAHPHKIGTTSVRVLREVDAHLALGPQGEQVVALIGRCRSLTGDELDRLDSARAVTRDAAWVAARDAALGLLLRDLIGQHPGWDQGAYDLLTGPWRQIIGPLHPDDAEEIA